MNPLINCQWTLHLVGGGATALFVLVIFPVSVSRLSKYMKIRHRINIFLLMDQKELLFLEFHKQCLTFRIKTNLQTSAGCLYLSHDQSGCEINTHQPMPELTRISLEFISLSDEQQNNLLNTAGLVRHKV